MIENKIKTVKQKFGIVGNSTSLNHAIEVAIQVAPTDMSVLITGESGSGKESFSKIIHSMSKRKHGQFIAVNCGAIPEGTIDSELFGHEKGSFTGANESRKGYFEVTNGGTIFLDEIGEMPLSTQSRLLRIIENGEFIKVGSSKVLKTDVRIIAATNIKLKDAVKIRMTSDVPIGDLLSGGVDSSAVTAFASQYCSTPLETFHIDWCGVEGKKDEKFYARLVADKFKTKLNITKNFIICLHILTYI